MKVFMDDKAQSTAGSGITSLDLFGVPFTGDNSQNWPYYSFHSFDALRALQGDFYLGSLVTGAYYGDRFELVLDVYGDGDGSARDSVVRLGLRESLGSTLGRMVSSRRERRNSPRARVSSAGCLGREDPCA